MIEFKSLSFKNILSYGNSITTINLSNDKLALYRGSNGSGKSGFLDALCFSLFGKPFRPINIPQLVNYKNKKDMLCEIEFYTNNNNYIIKRGLNPTIFEVYKEGELLNQNSSSKDYQTFLEETILHFDFNTFTQIVILGKAIYTSFMQLRTPQRRKFIETVSGTTIFSVMNELHKLYINKTKEEFQELKNKISLLTNIISHTENHISNIKNDIIQATKEKHRKIELLIQEELNIIELNKEKIYKLKRLIEDNILEELDKNRERLISLEKLKTRAEFKLKNHEKEQLFFDSNSSCPTCEQSICEHTKEIKLRKIKESIQSINIAFNDILNKIQETRTNITQLECIHSNNNKNQNIISKLNAFIQEKTNHIEQLRKEQKEEVIDYEQVKREELILLQHKKELEELLIQKDEFLNTELHNEFVSQMLKDSGIKKMIIQKYIPIINSIVNSYLNKLGFNGKFELDEEFQEHIYSLGMVELSYFNFSEGEKSRIDAALLMAWREIASIRANMKTNLFILDEIAFNGSLDESATVSFLEMLKELKDTNVIVISHTIGDFISEFDKVYTFNKINGFSKITN